MNAFEKAQFGYDRAHEQALVDAIVRAIIEKSYIGEPPPVLCIRTGELASALTTVLAMALALSPAAVRSPATIRKLTDRLRQRLIKSSAAMASDPATRDFLARAFRNDDSERGGHA
jgi:hypothetical protein